MKCKKCGEELVENARFCEACGEKVTAENEQNIQPIPETNPKKPLYKKPYFGVILAGAIILILCIINFSTNKNYSNSSERVTETTIAVESATKESDNKKSTTKEPTTAEPTTEKATEKITEPPTEKITNNTSANGFWAEGSGDYVAENLNVTNYAVLHITHSGSSNFAVKLYKDDTYEDLLVNTIGDYSGDVLVEDSGKYELEITADGNWNITSDGLSIDDTTSFSGTGDGVTGITSHSGGNWHITNSGSSNFVVIEYGESLGYMELLVNEIGNYDGTVKAESGDNIFFKVTSEGSWTIKKK